MERTPTQNTKSFKKHTFQIVWNETRKKNQTEKVSSNRERWSEWNRQSILDFIIFPYDDTLHSHIEEMVVGFICRIQLFCCALLCILPCAATIRMDGGVPQSFEFDSELYVTFSTECSGSSIETNHKINGNQIKYRILFILLKIHKWPNIWIKWW